MLAVVAALALGPGLTLRTSQTDVTPPELLPLGGYTQRADKKMEPGGDALFARAVLFESGGKKVAIVAFDALTIPESLVVAVKKRMPDDVSLVLVATHTHSAPDSQMLNDRMTFKVPGIASFSRRWMEWYADKLASSVKDAIASAPQDGASLKMRQGEVDANHGRREGAQPDKTATWIALGGRPVLTIYAAHGTVYDEKRNQTSGDWMGAYAKDSGGLVVPGALGDVSPDYPTGDPVENLAAMVEKLKAAYRSARVIDLWQNGSSLTFVQEKIALDKPVPSPAFAKEFGVASPLDQVLIQRFAPLGAEVTIVQAGGLLLIGIPGEPSAAVGRKVQVLAATLGFPHAVVISHCNGWIGYVLEPEDYDRGGYESALCFNGRETALRVTEAVERALKRLAQPIFEAHTR